MLGGVQQKAKPLPSLGVSSKAGAVVIWGLLRYGWRSDRVKLGWLRGVGLAPLVSRESFISDGEAS